MQCPIDQSEMRVHVSGQLDVESCLECAGVWVHHSRLVAFKDLTGLIAGTEGLAESLRGRDGGPSEGDLSLGGCPTCGNDLRLGPVDGDVQAAVCISCGGAWIESDQMSHLLWDGPDIRMPTSLAGADTDPDRIAAKKFDRFSFNHPLVFVLALPLATVGALAINSSFLAGLMRPFHIWIHECGHATIAWLSGRRALPLPIGWTSWQPERSTVVYLALLFLLGVLFHTAWKERLRGAMVFAVAVALAQLVMTWSFSQQKVELWITFGGIGGEFYLSALLMILFYFPMPDRFRWDFWRYGILVIAASTFWENFSFWKRVEGGRERIPWGSILGAGDAGGDMDRLVFQHQWLNDRIIGTYNGLANACLLVLLGVYIGFLIAERSRIIPDLRQRVGLGKGTD
jgi:Zn-finger nucleic acid-binding protein